MHNLQAVASSSLSLPADSYIYGITAAAPGTFAAISSDDSLRVFDADLNRGAVISSHTHDGVTSLRSYAESQLSQVAEMEGEDLGCPGWWASRGDGDG